jgi:predicted metal-binding membrane protein
MLLQNKTAVIYDGGGAIGGAVLRSLRPARADDAPGAAGEEQMTVEEQMPRGKLERTVYEGDDWLKDGSATRTSLDVTMTSARTAARAAALTATLALAAASWVVAVHQMNGMDMGLATGLGSFAFFVAAWVPMMAAMMLPGAVPAVLECARADGRVRAVLLFVGSYLAVWTVVGLAVYALYQPHGSSAAGVLTVAAGAYELTPLKRYCRRRCRTNGRSGFQFGLYCVGSSIGLMVMLVALGVMSVTWMSVVAVLVLAQKLLPPRASIDVPLAFAILALGIVIAVAPSSIPGLSPTM